MRGIAAIVLVATLAGGCLSGRTTNRQVAQGALAVGAFVGILVLYALVQSCADRYGGECRDPDEPLPPPR